MVLKLLLLALFGASAVFGQEASHLGDLVPGVNTYTIDGSKNNLYYPDATKAGSKMTRLDPVTYDGRYITDPDYPYGPDNWQGDLEPRDISNTIFSVTKFEWDQRVNQLWVSFGQLMDHDFALTSGKFTPEEAFSINIPRCDPWLDPNCAGNVTIGSFRTNFITEQLYGRTVRQQLNANSPALDMNFLYGSDPALTDIFRSHKDGKLRSSFFNGTEFLPTAAQIAQVDATAAQFPLNFGTPPEKMLWAPELRVNENPALTMLTTMFMKEHNSICDILRSKYPSWSDEQIFWRARRWNIAQYQSIVYNEFVPLLVGPLPRYAQQYPYNVQPDCKSPACFGHVMNKDQLSSISEEEYLGLPPYKGYDSSLYPQVLNVFQNGAYRFAHAMLTDFIGLIDKKGEFEYLRLSDTFFAPQFFFEEPDMMTRITRGQVYIPAKYPSPDVVESLRSQLFGPTDLVCFDVRRAEDHGLPLYNDVRALLGLKPNKLWTDITWDNQVRGRAFAAYNGYIDKLHYVVGGLLESSSSQVFFNETSFGLGSSTYSGYTVASSGGSVSTYSSYASSSSSSYPSSTSASAPASSTSPVSSSSPVASSTSPASPMSSLPAGPMPGFPGISLPSGPLTPGQQQQYQNALNMPTPRGSGRPLITGPVSGESLTVLFRKQFTIHRDGDRFSYYNRDYFTADEQAALKKVTISSLLRKHFGVCIQDYAFAYDPYGVEYCALWMKQVK